MPGKVRYAMAEKKAITIETLQGDDCVSITREYGQTMLGYVIRRGLDWEAWVRRDYTTMGLVLADANRDLAIAAVIGAYEDALQKKRG